MMMARKRQVVEAATPPPLKRTKSVRPMKKEKMVKIAKKDKNVLDDMIAEALDIQECCQKNIDELRAEKRRLDLLREAIASSTNEDGDDDDSDATQEMTCGQDPFYDLTTPTYSPNDCTYSPVYSPVLQKFLGVSDDASSRSSAQSPKQPPYSPIPATKMYIFYLLLVFDSYF